jgi:hypothetical protein
MEIDNGGRNSDLYSPLSAIKKNMNCPREGQPMTPSLVEEERLDVPPEQRRTVDLVKRIRKLRWIGMEQEAAKLQLILARFPPTERVILSSRETD